MSKQNHQGDGGTELKVLTRHHARGVQNLGTHHLPIHHHRHQPHQTQPSKKKKRATTATGDAHILSCRSSAHPSPSAPNYPKCSQVRKKKGKDSDPRRSHPAALPIICGSTITNGTNRPKCSQVRRKKGQEQRPETLTCCPKS